VVVKSTRVRSSRCGKEATVNDNNVLVGNMVGQPKVRRPVGRPKPNCNNIVWFILRLWHGRITRMYIKDI
jgi:hypothetical protein